MHRLASKCAEEGPEQCHRRDSSKPLYGGERCMSDIEIKRGLKDVYFATSEASFIDGNIGKLLYRGYNIDDMARNSTFEETVYLLLYGKLPTAKELSDFDAQLRANRTLPREVLQVIEIVQASHPMDVLRTAVSALAAFDPDTADNSKEATLRKGIRLTAQAPTIVAAHDRIRPGKAAGEPNPRLGHAANFLYMLFGKEPDPEEAKLIDLDFVLHAEHGSNASALAAPVTASPLADLRVCATPREREKAMPPHAPKGISVHVDFYAGSVYHLLGVAEDLFIPIFAMGRVPGWTLQVMEQFADNILLPPLNEY